EEIPQMPADKIDHGIAAHFRAVRLPQGAEQFPPGLEVRFIRIAVCPEPLAQPHFLEVTGKEPLVIIAAIDRLAAVRVDHTSLKATGLGHVVRMPPKQSQLSNLL